MWVTYERIRAALLAVLTKHEYTFGLVFWTPADWRRLQWNVLKEAALVLSFEGSDLGDALVEDARLVADLNATLNALGGIWEQGHSWSLGVYRIPPATDIDPEAIVARCER
jgi:hypothetical protein